jgi:hypothetical protein
MVRNDVRDATRLRKLRLCLCKLAEQQATAQFFQFLARSVHNKRVPRVQSVYRGVEGNCTENYRNLAGAFRQDQTRDAVVSIFKVLCDLKHHRLLCVSLLSIFEKSVLLFLFTRPPSSAAKFTRLED